MRNRRVLGLMAGAAFLIGAVALTFELGAAQADGDSDSDGDGDSMPAKRIRVASVELATRSREVRFAGVVRAAERAHLSFPVGARLAQRPVEVGDSVGALETVARLDAAETTNAVVTATAALAEIAANRRRLEQDLERTEQLFVVNAATREEVERGRQNAEALAAAAAAAESRLREARRRRAETDLVAPFAGTVTAVGAEPGEFVRPGQTIVILSGSGALEVEIGLPESMVAELVEGTAVAVELPLARGREVAGRLDRVGRASEAAGNLFPAVVALSGGADLFPGMTAEVVLTVGGAGSGLLSVPLAAVLNPGGRRPAVFRLDGDRVTRVEVEVDSLVGERVALRGALGAGDEVVVTGHTSLLDGDPVEVIR